MVYVRSSYFTVDDGFSPPAPVLELGPTVVWLQGEHDIATDRALLHVVVEAIYANGADIVVDVRHVECMSASTLRVILIARQLLMHQSRSLTVRCPSACVRRIIDICGLGNLLGPRRDPQA